MNDLIAKFTELAKASKDFQTKYKTKADFGDMPEGVQCYLDDMGYAIRSLQYQLDSVFQWVQAHLQGHLPAVKSTEQLQRAVKALGLDAEYDVQKPTIQAGKNGRFIVS